MDRVPVNGGIKSSVWELLPVNDANHDHCQNFLKYQPVDDDQECHDNIKLSRMLVLLEN